MLNSKLKKFVSVMTLLMIVSVFFCAVGFAADPVTLNPEDTTGFETKVTEGVNKFAGTLQALIGVVAAAYLMWGAVLFITASGDAQKIATAKDKFKYALAGVVLAYLSDKIVGMIYGWIN